MRYQIERKLKYLSFLKHRNLRRLKRIRKKRLYRGRSCKFIFVNKNEKTLSAYLSEKNFFAPSVFLENKVSIKIPKVFSMIENPEESIKILKMTVTYGLNRKVKQIFVDHTKCESLDICASTIMDVIILEIKRIRKCFSISGSLKGNCEVSDILFASGLPKHLGFNKKIPENMKLLPLLSGNNFNDKDKSGEISTQIIDYYGACLSTQGYQLTEYGNNYMGQMLGEVIENCQNHGGENSKWYVLGHYQMDSDGKFGKCHLVIFNFGDTFYQNMKHIRCDDIRQSLKNLTKKHQHSGWLSLNKSWSEESLWTLYALQDGVSSLRNPLDPDRGTGTIKLINAFQSIGSTANGDKPKMCIISGHTFIYFDGKYTLQKKVVDGEEREVIAFNSENDLVKPPDKNYVKTLKQNFPGTIISMCFYLDKRYISDAIKKGDSGDEQGDTFRAFHKERC